MKVSELNRAFHEIGVSDCSINVSNCVRENEIIRSVVPPERAYVIPNSIDTSCFKPDPSLKYPLGTINIVYMARLDPTKGNYSSIF